MKKPLAVLILLLAVTAFVPAQQKFALVIGNGNYTSFGKLANALNDANDVTAALQGLGFSVDKVLDGDRPQMESAITRLRNNLSKSKSSYGFIFYAGHGVQFNGVNYLIPAKADIPNANYLGDRAVSVQTMLAELNDAGNELNVVVLDACRDYPAAWSRSMNRGLTVVANQPADSIIVYATSAGSVASDGTGRNGIFTGHLLTYLKNPSLDIKEVFDQTGAAVARASNRQQIPAIYSQYFGKAYLGAKPAAGSAPASTSVTTGSAPVTTVVTEQVSRDDLLPQGLKYEIKNGKVTITKYEGSEAHVNIPAAIQGLPVIEIGKNAFYNLKNVTKVTIPSSVTTIGESALAQCGITDITIPASVTTIGKSAFRSCNLTSVIIPGSVTTVGFEAFYLCTNLTNVTIGSSVTSIGSSAFGSCKKLSNIDVSSGNGAYTTIDGILFDKSGKTLVCYPAGKSETSYTIPSSVIKIGGGAFASCINLTSIIIPSSVTVIGEYAFTWCQYLTSVTIPGSVITIERDAFRDCRKLTSVTIPASVTAIGLQAFFSCDSLTNVTIPASVTTIGMQAFRFCKNLTSVTIPPSVTSIGENAFSDTKLTKVTLSRKTVLGKDAFDKTVKITYKN